MVADFVPGSSLTHWRGADVCFSLPLHQVSKFSGPQLCQPVCSLGVAVAKLTGCCLLQGCLES